MISPRSARSHRDPISRGAIRDAHSPAPQDFREYVSLIPTSAHTGEGVPDILMLLVQITQKMMVERIMWTPLVQCTVDVSVAKLRCPLWKHSSVCEASAGHSLYA